jgi:hypothetical protein
MMAGREAQDGAIVTNTANDRTGDEAARQALNAGD